MPELAIVSGDTGSVASSPVSPISWSVAQVDTAASAIRAVVFDGEFFYAFSSSGDVFKSVNGTSWGESLHTFPHGALHNGATRNKDILVPMANGWLGGLRDGYGWYSWQQTFGGVSVYGVASVLPSESVGYEDPKWVIVDGSGGIAGWDGNIASPGWTHWEDLNSPFWTPLLTVARGDGLWIVAGAFGNMAVSPDGNGWELVDSKFDGSCIYRVAFDQILGWIAVGAENKVSTSLDGYIWKAEDLSTGGACAPCTDGWNLGHRWLSAAAVGDCWMIGGDDRKIATLCNCSSYYYAPVTAEYRLAFVDDNDNELTYPQGTVSACEDVDNGTAQLVYDTFRVRLISNVPVNSVVWEIVLSDISNNRLGYSASADSCQYMQSAELLYRRVYYDYIGDHLFIRVCRHYNKRGKIDISAIATGSSEWVGGAVITLDCILF